MDRFYMLQFLRRHAPATGSRILEVERPEWTERLGLADATVDVLDIDPHNLAATVLADLGQAGTLDESSYDGILLMQTLQYVEHPGDALANAYLALAPGGRLLLSVPTISRIDEMCGPTGDRWRWTPAGLRSLVGSALGDVPCTVEGFGTLPAATAFLLGVPAEQMRPRDLWPSDDRFPVVACARVDKPGE